MPHPHPPRRSASARALRLALLGVALLVASGATATSARAAAPLDWELTLRKLSWGAGASAKVHLLEFTDFQCPFCSRATKVLGELEERYPDQLRITTIHRPLSFHQRAKAAAIAATAAARQGRFYGMRELLFEHQRELEDADLEAWAERAELSLTHFRAHRDDPATRAFVERCDAVAVSAGARGTPTFFLNGRKLTGAQPADTFATIIDEELEASGKQQGLDWIADRTKVNNADLHALIYLGVEPSTIQPPDPPARKPRAAEKSAEADKVWAVTVDEGDASIGPRDALVTMVVFTDFQCPYCKRLEPTLAALSERYGSELRIVWKHNPLPFHQRADEAAHAALCAHEQGRFGPMAEAIFEHPRSLEDGDLATYARSAKLKRKRFKKCYDARKHQGRIDADKALARKVSATGTPSSFINGKKLAGARPEAQFVEAIDAALAGARALLKAGTKRAELYDRIIARGEVDGILKGPRQVIDLSGAPTDGPKGAEVRVVVFHDHQCPYCARLHPHLRELRERLGSEVAISYRHMPLSFHKQARPAAIAALCAHEQGAYLGYSEGLLERHTELGAGLYTELAQEHQLDAQAFTRCLAAPPASITQRLEQDLTQANALEVRGTPAVFVDGRRYKPRGGWGVEGLIEAVQEAKKAKR